MGTLLLLLIVLNPITALVVIGVPLVMITGIARAIDNQIAGARNDAEYKRRSAKMGEDGRK